MLRADVRIGDLGVVPGISETSTSPARPLLHTFVIIGNRREGRSVLYRLDDAHLQARWACRGNTSGTRAWKGTDV